MPQVRSTRRDYVVYAPALMARLANHSLPLREYVRWPRNPAHNRMVRYVAGFKRFVGESVLLPTLKDMAVTLQPPLGEASAQKLVAEWPRFASSGAAAAAGSAVTMADLELAASRLADGAWQSPALFFGLVERMNDTLALLDVVAGWRRPASGVAPTSNPSVNASSNQRTVGLIPDGELEAVIEAEIAASNVYDQGLYDLAEVLLVRQVG